MSRSGPIARLCRCLAAAAAAAAPAAAAASTTAALYGRMPDGTTVEQYTLTNSRGLICRVITYGARLTSVETPDRQGRLGEITLGCDSLTGYLSSAAPFGATIGRVANRIAQGRFSLDGRTYQLPRNGHGNTIHGGPRGFGKVVWSAEPLAPSGVALSMLSPAGDQGFPGNLRVSVRYLLTDDDRLRLEYSATTDQDTPVNLTNHTYWNLSGGGPILGEVLTVRASNYTPVDSRKIPTGQIALALGGPLDFTTPTPIGVGLQKLGGAGGYDFNWVLDAPGGAAWVAELADPASGRVVRVYTDQPGIQVFTPDFPSRGIPGRNGARYRGYEAVCLETQHFPDSVNHPNFPSTILHPGQVYRTTTVYAFGTK